MRAPASTADRTRRTCPLVACARCFLVLLGSIATSPAFAGDETQPDLIRSAPSQDLPRTLSETDDEFLPVTKVVPRAKIVLRNNERLPDRDGAKTFAAYGTKNASDVRSAGDPMVPMYSFAYHPLYFEDMNLERCGLSCGCCVQPVVSGLLFFGTVAILPYKMLVSPPCSYVFPPGECLPGCRFGHCENFIGPSPDFSSLFRNGGSWRRRNCH